MFNGNAWLFWNLETFIRTLTLQLLVCHAYHPHITQCGPIASFPVFSTRLRRPLSSTPFPVPTSHPFHLFHPVDPFPLRAPQSRQLRRLPLALIQMAQKFQQRTLSNILVTQTICVVTPLLFFMLGVRAFQRRAQLSNLYSIPCGMCRECDNEICSLSFLCRLAHSSVRQFGAARRQCCNGKLHQNVFMLQVNDGFVELSAEGWMGYGTRRDGPRWRQEMRPWELSAYKYASI